MLYTAFVWFKFFASSNNCLTVVLKLLGFLVLPPDDVPLNFVKTNYCHPQ